MHCKKYIYINNIASACLLLLNKHPVLVFLLASHMYAVRTYFFLLQTKFGREVLSSEMFTNISNNDGVLALQACYFSRI